MGEMKKKRKIMGYVLIAYMVVLVVAMVAFFCLLQHLSADELQRVAIMKYIMVGK